MEIKYNKAEQYDQVINLHKQIFNENNIGFFNNLQTKNYYKTFVATQGNKVVAYCIISEILDEAEIINIATDKDFRQHNIASNLLKYSLDNINAKTVFLEVSANNVAAKKLYEKCGFKAYATRKKYYGDTDAILMNLQKN